MQRVLLGSDYDIAKYYIECFPETTNKTPIKTISINLSESVVSNLSKEITLLSKKAANEIDHELQKIYMDHVNKLWEVCISLHSSI